MPILPVDDVGSGSALVGPCQDWISAADIAACHDTDDIAAGVISQAIDAASDLLYRWSGYRYPGVCSATVRPCAQNATMDAYASTAWPYGWGGSYGWGDWGWNPGWGTCACQASPHRACGCQMLSEVRLGRAPVVAITTVKVDGVALANTAYRVDDHEFLVRVDGDSWPCCQSIELADTQLDTWSVAFTWGATPPASARPATVDLAAEFIRQCTGGSCVVPDRVARLDRQGTMLQFISAEQFGRVQGTIRAGLKSVDLFLSAVGTNRPGVIISPDSVPDTRRVGT